MKWSVIVIASSNDIIKFTRCLQKLAKSVDLKRTEIIISGYESFMNKWGTLIADSLFISPYVSAPYGTPDGEPIANLYNNGTKIAAGEFLCFVDDSVVVSDNFLMKLTHGMTGYAKKYQSDEVTFASPVTNMILPRPPVNADNVDMVQEQIDKQPEQAKHWAYTSTHSRFCFLVTKEAWLEVGGLDSQFEGNESLMMADYVNRFFATGRITALATDVLVYVDKVHDDSKDHYLKYYDKQVFPSGRLAILYRIKLWDETDYETFITSLQKASTLGAECIIVLDDNSKVKVSRRLKEEHPELRCLIQYECFTRPYDEKRDWNQLLDWATLGAKCNWILCLEGDEVLEDKVTAELITKLINPVNPKTLGYGLSHYYFWNDKEHWRMDNFWGKQVQVRLARVLPGRHISGPGNLANSCGYVPVVPKENIKPTSIRIKNYGFLTLEKRLEKQNFYQKVDPKTSYENFVDEFKLVRYDWPENSSIGVYTPVKKGGPALDSWLDHVGSFFDEIVIGNDGMEPDDVKKIEWWGGKIVLTKMGDNFAKGRNLIIKQCTTDWIVQLDLDEKLEDFVAIRRMADAIVDAIMFPIANLQQDNTSILTETIRMFRRTVGVEYWGYLHETVDDWCSKTGQAVSYSPTRIVHYGYLQSTPQQLWEKMQRYIDINLKQIEDFPEDGRAYFNLALHLLEDGLIPDALRCLNLASVFFPSGLVAMELGKTSLKTASYWLNIALKTFPQQNGNVPYLRQMVQNLQPMIVENNANARGHCISYLMRNPVRKEWLSKHLDEMDQKVANLKAGIK